MFNQIYSYVKGGMMVDEERSLSCLPFESLTASEQEVFDKRVANLSECSDIHKLPA